MIIEQWRREYNEWRPHSSLGYRTPAEAAARCQTALRASLAALAMPFAAFDSAAKPSEILNPITPELQL